MLLTPVEIFESALRPTPVFWLVVATETKDCPLNEIIVEVAVVDVEVRAMSCPKPPLAMLTTAPVEEVANWLTLIRFEESVPPPPVEVKLEASLMRLPLTFIVLPAVVVRLRFRLIKLPVSVLEP